MTTDTMRRVRSYRRATDRRTGSRMFQRKMLAHLIQVNKRPAHKKTKEQDR